MITAAIENTLQATAVTKQEKTDRKIMTKEEKSKAKHDNCGSKRRTAIPKRKRKAEQSKAMQSKTQRRKAKHI